MQTLEWTAVRVDGGQDARSDDDGTTVSRLPAWARAQVLDPTHLIVADMPAGVRVALCTDSRALELDVQLTLVHVLGQPLSTAAFDLVVDGEVRQSVRCDVGRVVEVDRATQGLTVRPGGPTTVRFDALPGDPRARVEVWLPHGAGVALRSLRVDDGAVASPPADRAPSWVHYGSSISHCFEAPSPTRTWPALVALPAGLDLQNLAVAGQCQLDPHVARTIRDLPAALISAEVGINVVNHDAVRERVLVPLLHGFLDTVRDGHPTTPVVLVSPVLCPVVEDHPGPTLLADDGRLRVVPRPDELAVGSLTLRRVRELLTLVVAARRQAGDENLHLVDGLSLLGPDDVGLLHDGLHPSAEGYELMASRFHRQVAPLLG